MTPGQHPTPGPRYQRRRALYATVALLLSLMTVEGLLRLARIGGTVEFEPSETWGYLMRPSQDVSTFGLTVHINPLGFRGARLAEPKPAGTRRIAFVGDSVTYGGGRLADDEVFADLTANALTRDGRPVDMLNVAAPAWSPENWMAYVRERGLHDADLVVLVLPECDLARAFSTMTNRDFSQHADPLRLLSMGRWAWHLMSGAAAESGWPFTDPEAGPSGGDVERRQVARNVAAVAALLEYSRARSVPLLAVLVPSMPASSYHRFWPQFESLVPGTIDLRAALSAPGLLQDGVHLNAAGHRVVAERIAREVRERLGW